MADIAYRRVSTTDQDTGRQLDNIDMTFYREYEDKVSGATTDRPQLQSCMDMIREGDTLHVHSIDRLSRSLIDLDRLVRDLNGKGVSVHFHKEKLNFVAGEEDDLSRLMFRMMGAFAEFERSLIKTRQREGIAKAKAAGKHLGRSAALTAEQVEEIRLRKEDGEQVIDLAEEFEVSRQTIYVSLKKTEEAKI